MVRTRIAPSPTGNDIHIGNLYTALINWTYAKKNNGQFIIRIEDTDRERYVEGAEHKILISLKAFGLEADEDPEKGGPYAPYKQSERLSTYKEYAEDLVKKNLAYYCFCSKERLDEVRKKLLAEKKIPKYDRHCFHTVKDADKRIKNGEKYVIRMKVPENQEIVVNDVIRGKIKFNSNDLDDQVLIKSDGYPTYHLAVVVDDHLMKISHIIRAEEWLPSTPKHVLLFQAFGWEIPVFVHVSILRNPDRSKLSKRKNPVWASWYLEQGYLPEAVLNYLALMGWSHPEGKEIFDLQEFIKVFDIKDLKAVAPIFDINKLEWLNGEYIRKAQSSKLKDQILKFYNNKLPESIVEKTIPLVQERIKKLSDYLPLCEFFFKEPEKYELDLSSKKDLLTKIAGVLKEVTDWKPETIGKSMVDLATQIGVKNSEFFMILRIAISGKKITPPLNESMGILGKEECIKRINKLVK